MTPDQIERYKRHLLVKEIGGSGQKKLLNARVIIVGAGALGGPAALTLAAAGVGEIEIYDDDVVDVSNLQRQTQFTSDDISMPKLTALKTRINALNPDVQVITKTKRWLTGTDTRAADVILDGTDNFESRFAINDWSRKSGTPFVNSAVAGWQGQVMLVNDPNTQSSPCYQCLVPETPVSAGDCNDMGVVGAVSQIVSNHAALITLRHILGLKPEFGMLSLIDGLSGSVRKVKVSKDPNCQTCGDS